MGLTHSLTVNGGDLRADAAVATSGHEPNGYFWEGVVTYLAPELVDRVELDSEAGMFSAMGETVELERLRDALEPLLDDGPKAAVLIERAEAGGFQFDD